MTTDLLIICATVLLLAIIFVFHAERAQREAPAAPAAGTGPAIGARVLVHKLDGQGLQGEVVACSDAGVVLEKVDLVADGKKTATGGRWHIGAERIDSIQEL